MDMRSIKSYNDGYSYVLPVVDAVSKYRWSEPTKDKTSKNVSDAFERILSRSNGRKPVCLQTDKGKEFMGGIMQRNLTNHGITYRVARSPDTKAIKERTWRYFTHKNTRWYVDVLQKIIEAYNHTKHSATKIIPASVTLYNG